MKTCIRCGNTALVQNPLHPHWFHCPWCDPKWAEFSQLFSHLLKADAYAKAAAADTRGRPQVGPVT